MCRLLFSMLLIVYDYSHLVNSNSQTGNVCYRRAFGSPNIQSTDLELKVEFQTRYR